MTTLQDSAWRISANYTRT